MWCDGNEVGSESEEVLFFRWGGDTDAVSGDSAEVTKVLPLEVSSLDDVCFLIEGWEIAD